MEKNMGCRDGTVIHMVLPFSSLQKHFKDDSHYFSTTVLSNSASALGYSDDNYFD